MTKSESCKLLGISQSAGPAKAERAYLKKHNELRYKLCPGNTKADRQKAQVKMAKLMTARDILCRIPSAPKSYHQKTNQRKTTRPKPKKAKPAAAANNYSKPQTLAEAWNLIVTMMPFSQPAVAILFLLMFLLVILRLLSSL